MSIAERLQGRIGEIVREVRFPIEVGKIAEFARAIKDKSDRHNDLEAAQSEGFSAIPAPLTFSVASAHFSGGDATELPVRLGLDLARLVHGEHRWVYHRPLVAGDVLFGATRIAAVDRRPGRNGDMTRVTLETDFRDAENTPVLTETMLLIELPKT